MRDSRWHPAQAGKESLTRISRLVDGLGGELGKLASDLLASHGYQIDSEGGGPHLNVLGHPLFELPIWLDQATSESRQIDSDVLLDICESSLCGYLSVRAEDDYFDRHSGQPEAAMMLSGFFRARHQALLGPIVSDRRFWTRFESLWHAYGEAMLRERELHDPAQAYGPAEFDFVLNRSQPLEIPGQAVLSIKGRWDWADRLAELVWHLTKATQLFDDFVDAPDDLAAGNYTWMVRRLGGLEGEAALHRGMIASGDEVVAEAGRELGEALGVAGDLGIGEIFDWVEARKRVMKRASERMYEALFENLGSDD
ncbi:MAG: hypothetical protein ACE5MI_03695 [Acidimicrobiia bacterium]